VYWKIRAPQHQPAPGGLSVDVFIPVYDEPEWLVERCIGACLAMSYPHRTYLLDDSSNGRYEILARKHGVTYRARQDKTGAKAGNLNAALGRSAGDFVTIFDVDHVPEPDFLHDVLGHFDEPEVGFVQGAVGFSNADEAWITRAIAEQSSDAYGPASMGMHGCHAAPVWGSHCTFRRSALESVGGHHTGLAEDLHTSIRLHASGWRSVFVPSLKARGLVPTDLSSSMKQQFKWARGVFEVLLAVYPSVWRMLTLEQNIAYLLRCTYYLIGPVFLAHCLIAVLVLTSGGVSSREAFSQYLLFSLPFAGTVIWVRRLALGLWHAISSTVKSNWRGYLHTFLQWPVYTLAFLLALLRVRVGHIATPKVSEGRARPLLVAPQAVLATLLVTAVILRQSWGWTTVDIVPALFALGAAAVQAVAIFNELRSYRAQ
jgi:cellulose synthase (UDP-forming)